MGTGVADFEREMAEFLGALTRAERPIMNSTRYPRSVPGAFAPVHAPVRIDVQQRPGGIERLRVCERPRPTIYPLCISCFEPTDLTLSRREFCTGCASEVGVVYVEPDYSRAGERRLAQRLPNGKPAFMY